MNFWLFENIDSLWIFAPVCHTLLFIDIAVVTWLILPCVLHVAAAVAIVVWHTFVYYLYFPVSPLPLPRNPVFCIGKAVKICRPVNTTPFTRSIHWTEVHPFRKPRQQQKKWRTKFTTVRSWTTTTIWRPRCPLPRSRSTAVASPKGKKSDLGLPASSYSLKMCRTLCKLLFADLIFRILLFLKKFDRKLPM